ncbi:MAG: glycosyltransferase [Candidatus Dependentiae bacterium]|jgi:glycosyltransferase involved in cell wall biosynthesis
MRILHLKDTLEVGGISAVLTTLIQHTPHVQHTVATFAPGPFAKNMRTHSATVHHITTPTYRRVAQFVAKHRPDVIHALGFTMMRHARLLHRLTGIPVVCGIHGDLNKIGRLQRHVQHLLMKVMGNWCSAYVCVSEEVRRILLTKVPRSLSAQKAYVIHNGIDLAAVTPDTQFNRTGAGLPQDRFVIGSVGRLAGEKSYDLLLRSTAPLCREKKAVVCLVGDGPEQGKLQRLAADLCIANDVFFMGRQTPSMPWYFLFDCFALSSQTEGLSISLLEAMAAGLPVVSTSDHTREHPVLTNNKDGILVPVNNEHELHDALAKIISDAPLRQRLKKEALNSVKKFSAQSMAKQYESLFRALQ